MVDPADPPEEPPKLTRPNLALRRRGVRECWDVPRDIIIETLYQCYQILADAKANHREKLAASRMIDRLVRSDQAEDKLDLEMARTAHPDVADARADLLSETLAIVRGHRRAGPDP